MDWFLIGKGVLLFNLYAEYIMQNARLDDTTLMAESKELKSLLMKVKEKSEKAGLKINI